MSTSFFSNQNVNICLADNRNAYQLYFSSRNNTVTRSFTAEYENNEYAECYGVEGFSLDLAEEDPARVFTSIDNGNQDGRIYVNIGDVYEQISYV
jgi:hypothetical protein